MIQNALNLNLNGEIGQLIWKIRRLPLYPEDVQSIPLDNPDYCLRHRLNVHVD